jgi:hypothetical protein
MKELVGTGEQPVPGIVNFVNLEGKGNIRRSRLQSTAWCEASEDPEKIEEWPIDPAHVLGVGERDAAPFE